MTEAAFAARILLAGAFLLAGLAKLGRPHETTYRRIREVIPLPEPLGRAIARRLPVFELALATFLAAGVVSSLVGLVASVSMLGFTAFLVAGRVRDPAFDCGCFGSNGGAVTWVSIGRNVALAVLGAVVFVAGDQPLSVDDLLGTPAARALDASQGTALIVLVTSLLVAVLLVNEMARAFRSDATLHLDRHVRRHA